MGDIRSPTQHDSLPMFGAEKTEKGKGRGIFLEEERKWGEERKQKQKEEKRENLNNGGPTQRDA